MNDMVDKDKQIPKIRFKGYVDEWELIKLGNIGEVTSAGVNKKSYEGQDNVYLLNYMDVYNKKNINEDNKNELMVVTASEEEIINKNVKKGDIFFTPSSETKEDIGHSLTIKHDIKNLVYSYHIMRFRPNSEVLDINYSQYCTNTEPVRKQLIFEGQGVQRVVFTISDLENTIIQMPSYNEQEKIGNFFKALDDKLDQEKSKLETFRNLKTSLLQKMFV